MSELAFTVNGDTFEVPNTVSGWRVRRLKPRGAPELVYARDGRPLTLPIEADLDDLHEAVTACKYRLDPIGDDGKADCDTHLRAIGFSTAATSSGCRRSSVTRT